MMRSFILTAVLTFSSFALAKPEVLIDVTLVPTGSFVGKTSDIKGFATRQGDRVVAENIIVDLKNIKTGIGLRDKHMADKYLEVKKHPEAILVKAVGKGGKGKGLLKIKDIQKEVQGTFTIAGEELMAEFPVKLSDFGITGIKYMGVGVNDKVILKVTVPLQ